MTHDKRKYILLSNSNNLKTQSLEDNIYFTLRDVFLNISVEFKMYEANELNVIISNGIYNENRTSDFSYVNLTSEPDLVRNILRFLNEIKQDDFEYETEKSEPDKKSLDFNYIDFDIWWKQLENLKTALSNFQNKN